MEWANMGATITQILISLERYTISTELFSPRLPHDEDSPLSYREITTDKLLKKDE
jgi:hypothetical protein